LVLSARANNAGRDKEHNFKSGGGGRKHAGYKKKKNKVYAGWNGPESEKKPDPVQKESVYSVRQRRGGRESGWFLVGKEGRRKGEI